MMTRLVSIAVLLTLAAAACSSGDRTTGSAATPTPSRFASPARHATSAQTATPAPVMP